MAGTQTHDPPRRAWPRIPPRLWAALKAVLVVAIVAAVAWQFAEQLRQPELWARPLSLQPGWLAAAATLCLVGLAFSAFFWDLLLRALGQRPRPLATLRAYYVGQLGRYVPGKVVGLAMRARLLAGPGVHLSVAFLTVVYESLTTLASGVLLGLVVLALAAPLDAGLWWRAVALLALLGVVLLPGVFNRLAERTTRPFRAADAPALPQVHTPTLLLGLGITATGWLVQGGALWALVQTLAPGAWAAPAADWSRAAAYVALSYAAGYLVFTAPGGLGVRDFVLQQFLAADFARTMGPEQAAAVAVVATLAFRVLGTAVDVLAAAVCYGLPGQAAAREERPAEAPPAS